ncbi:MarR family winged helix-turn-helix transcriptional regulator [Tepidibacter formicigenes]|jgi:DNA-binding MarR family transcriptional regulator|uniref:DNA-binding transcriptional regulator, MarR family n=1 Tax=Tepidibacter formicigenes DSM 15518 TaxID=1123349 RepID=A0A1M6Q662_9FIRM|nr:MarR family winged helix-turn-helix transcriptional regulator [Tepidibacter formicigenes]SHK15675.1 DNA-binding transcriptional regulator, MarR family [Tepidibacter formicigenes DSM 15518]
MENHSINMYLAMIERDYNYYINKKLKQYNLGKHDIRVLKVINANKGLSQNDICTILKEDKITVNKSVKNLVSQGYVEKIKDCEDKRITRLYITEEGRVNRKKILNILNEANDIFVKGFSEKNKENILELLKKMSENIHKEAVRIKDEK